MTDNSSNPAPVIYNVGLLVENGNRPEWGPGKVGHVSGTKVWVTFRDLPDREAKQLETAQFPLKIAALQSDPILDNLPPLKREGDKWVLPRQRVTFEHAKRKFFNVFPGGFEDPKYLGDRHSGERNYKVWAHEHYQRELGDGRAEELLGAGNVDELVRLALSVVAKTNLLASFEAMALKDGLTSDRGASMQFFQTLLRLLTADTIERGDFEPYLDAVSSLPVKQSRVNTWPVATILPYLAQPTRHMFLKPVATSAGAEMLAFELHYNATPNWPTYDALRRMGRVYMELLKSLGARDLIDVQSFIWVTCGGGY